MDTVTHAMAGALIGAVGAKGRADFKASMVVGVAAGVAPDLDSVLYPIDYGYFLKYHRLWTHNVFGFVGLAFLCAIPGILMVKGRGKKMLLISGLATLSHLLLDLVCHFRLPLFYPFTKNGFQIPLVGFTYPPLLIGLTISTLLVLYLRRETLGLVDAGRK